MVNITSDYFFLLDALPEPAFLFGEDNRLRFSNLQAQAILPALGMKSVQALTYARFCKNFDLKGGIHAEDNVMAGDKHYRVTQMPVGDQKLIRFFPAPENLHLLRLSYSLDVMPWGIVTIDVAGRSPVALYGNARAGEFLQIPEQEIFGEDARVIFSGMGEWPEIEKRLFAPQKSTYGFETFPDGHHKWYNLHFIPYVRKTVYCLVVIEDATEEKILEGQFIQAQRLEALGKLAGGVAHDFNNILSIIDGYARMVRKNSQNPEKVFDCGEKIAQSVQRAAALTQKLLAFGRQKETCPETFDLGAVVKEQEPLLRPLLDASIQFFVDVEDQIFITADMDDIGQILMNLCVNARDAMPDGGVLTISARKIDEKAVLSVLDTGTGMDEQTKSRMFEPFFTTKPRDKGTGLGLSMVYGLVHDLKGSIAVKTVPGEGTNFLISFPLSQAPNQDHPGRKSREDDTDLGGLTALIAEDEPELLNLVCDMLEEMGVRVLKAVNGQDALLKQDEYGGRIDFLLTDVVMPELNGVKLAELFRAVRPESKIMFMSGYPQGDQITRIHLPDNAVLLSKPVNFKKLSYLLKKNIAEQNNFYLKEHSL